MNCNEYKFYGALNVITETEAADWNCFFPYPEPFCSWQEDTPEISQVCFSACSHFFVSLSQSWASARPGTLYLHSLSSWVVHAHSLEQCLQSNTTSHRLWSSVQAVGCPLAMITRCQGTWQVIPLKEQWLFTERRWELADGAAGTV